ncbi:TetR/AcrR family transcriptional regulator [Kibdelosporangium persicum]|nr:TetR/AcrR family transcriptional regulator [Kibdelosporangium persicum]
MGRPALVDREAIVRAAIEIGFDRLTMSAVGSHLGVAHSTLYRYFGSRDALASAAIDHCVDSVQWPEPCKDWREFLTATAWSFWTLYEVHRGLALEVSTLRTTSEALVVVTNRSALALLDSGFDADDAILVIDMLGELVTQAFLGATSAPEPTVSGASAADGQPHTVSVVDGVRQRRVELMRPWLDAYAAPLRDAFAEIILRPPVHQFEKKLGILLDGVRSLANGD